MIHSLPKQPFLVKISDAIKHYFLLHSVDFASLEFFKLVAILLLENLTGRSIFWKISSKKT